MTTFKRIVLSSFGALLMAACGGNGDATNPDAGIADAGNGGSSGSTADALVDTGSGGSSGAVADAQPDTDADALADAFADAEVDAAKAVALRVVTWNMHNFYDDDATNCKSCPFYAASDTPTPAAYQAKVSGIAKGLAKLNADVVMVEEVENVGVLDKLAADPSISALNYGDRRMVRGNDPRGVDIGVMSRFPIDQIVSHKSDSFKNLDAPADNYKFARDALEVHLTLNQRHVAFIGVHLKAKSYPDDPIKRLAEAQRVRQIADGIRTADPSALVLILGDCNDEPGSPPVLAMRDGRGGGIFEDAMDGVPAAERYSFTFNGANILIDHMFSSPELGLLLDPSSATILHDATLPSDHAPIAVSYWVK